MVKIISVDPEANRRKREAAYSKFMASFSAMDSFSKLMAVTFVILLILTPIVVFNTQLYTTSQNASSEFKITSPLNNSIVLKNAQVSVEAAATDPTITKVDMYVQGKFLCESVAKPFLCIWEVPNLSDQQFVIQAKAFTSSQELPEQSITVSTGH